MELEGQRLAALVEGEYEVTELWYPYYPLTEAGAVDKLAGTGRATRRHRKHGSPADADPAPVCFFSPAGGERSVGARHGTHALVGGRPPGATPAPPVDREANSKVE